MILKIQQHFLEGVNSKKCDIMRVRRSRPPPPKAGTPLARLQEQAVLLGPHLPCIPPHLSLLVMLFYFLLFVCTSRWPFLLSFHRESRCRFIAFFSTRLFFFLSRHPFFFFALYKHTRYLPFFSYHFFLPSSCASHPRGTLEPTATLRQQKRFDKDPAVG